MAFDMTVFDSHIRAASEAPNPMGVFDALWKAFNHYYESLYLPSDDPRIKEYELIHRAIDRIPAADRTGILAAAATSGIADIPSVFDARIWNRFGEQAIGRHEKVKRLLRRESAPASASSGAIKQVADLLYVVRCNAAHGFKTPDGLRDIQVFGAAVPVLKKVVDALPVAAEQGDAGVA